MLPIRFHFDYISPYSYIAWTQIHALASRTNRSVVPIPTLLAALLQAGNTRGPAEIPAKRLYIGKDCFRIARLLGIPFGLPPSHPFNPLLALRVSCIDMDKEARGRLIDALFHATWGGGDGVESEESVIAVANSAGLDGSALVAQASSPAIKDRLRGQTDEAIAAGVFGVPTMRIGDEIFWGYDSFSHLERFLRGEDPLSSEDFAKWVSLRPSVVRR